MTGLFAGASIHTGCSGYASVSETKPVFRPLRSAFTSLAIPEQKIVTAQKEESKDPAAAIGNWLVAVRHAEARLKVNPGETQTRDAYNYAVARVFDVIRKAKLDPWGRPFVVPSSEGEIVLTHRKDSRPGWDPALFDFTPADRIALEGSYVKNRTVRPGIGAPLVAKGKGMNERAKQDFTIPRIYYGVTALVRFEGNKAVVSFEDPLAEEEVRFAGRVQPMAADFTVPLAVMLASTEPRKLEIMRMLTPEKYAETARIARLQPYDPNKTVVLVIHGLMDSQATWTPMINTLRDDPEIRKNFQFWFYSYPSGYPYPYSAALLRKELDAIGKRYPMKNMVVVGHSMGGCISRLLMTDTGDKLWLELFKKRPEETKLSPETHRLASDAIIFDHRKEVGRVIYIAAPLKGSNLASRRIVRWASGIIRSPVKLLHAGSEMLQATTFEADDLKLERVPSSVDTLTPNNRFVKAINKLPLTPGIPYHTIIGDRGKGNSPDSSDGVVPYWSSHMEGAISEKIVPSGHSAHQNEEAIAEVRRILLLHRHLKN
ncbi:alpha/beta hydrolase [Luteolibacter luteus]|uniref:Alpha/beta hydrolase n=1 Tax=Luteolibacter luteus TaxID=2728835 RepID=A0A858RS07_9BACT|nr:alpha/beta hydrolase [Luteolibacter luteus]